MSNQLSLFPNLPAQAPKVKQAEAKPNTLMLREAMAAYMPTVNELPSAERPRARLEAYGSGALGTAELLAILIGTPHRVHDAEKLLSTLEGLPGIVLRP
jgi:hypothetical protein